MTHTLRPPQPDPSLAPGQEYGKNKNASQAGPANTADLPEPKSHPVDDLPERFLLFRIWTTKEGVCLCSKGKKCLKPGKHPEAKGWQDNAREASLEGMKGICDPANGKVGVVVNIGIRTGVETKPGWKLIVVDGDSEEACAWIEAFGVSTMTSITRRGKHYFFLVPDDVEIKNDTHIVPGMDQVDVRGEGGFVVAPGSVHQVMCTVGGTTPRSCRCLTTS